MKRIITTTTSFLFLANICFGQVWNTVGDIYDANPFGDVSVWDFNVQGDSLWIAGAFDQIGFAGDTLDVRGVLYWDSVEIRGLSGDVALAIEAYNGDIFIGGSGMNVLDENAIAGYDGSSWYDLDGGTTGSTTTVYDLLSWEGKMYACGSFGGMGSIDNPSIAAWNGNEWTDVGSFVGNGPPYCLEEFQGDLYAGGDFNTFSPPTTTSPSIARWDGTTWNEVGEGGVSGYIQAMVADTVNQLLYVGGWIYSIAGQIIDFGSVAAWDGEAWQVVGNLPFNSSVYSMAMYREQLYVSVAFSEFSDSLPTSHLARFDGVNWQMVDSASLGNILAMEVYKNELYLGGSFDFVGDLFVPGLVRYYLHPDSVTWGVPDTTISVIEHPDLLQDHSFKIFPNPSSGIFELQFDALSDLAVLITDSQGRQVFYNKQGQRKSLSIDLSNQASGTYLVSLAKLGRLVGTKRVVINRR